MLQDLRYALGARREHVLRIVVYDGLRPVLLGAAAGAIGAVVAAHALRGLLFGVAPLRPGKLRRRAGPVGGRRDAGGCTARMESESSGSDCGAAR
jgi:hypothetical protein